MHSVLPPRRDRISDCRGARRSGYRTLISYCPLLAASLEDCNRPANRNRILQTAFSKAEVLLREQTDAYTYFENLKISSMIVTNKTLDEVINASFTGIRHAG